MANRFVIVLLLVLCVYDAGGWMLLQKHLLSIYYESKCPDSKRFILEQLVPAMSLFKDNVELQFVPFGKSVALQNGGFLCQHGPEECLGNLVQDCALFCAGASFDNQSKLKYVACEAHTEAGSKGNLHCVRKAGIPLKDVHECVTSYRGDQLQLSSEYLTSLVRPRVIPSITYDQKFDDEFQRRSLSDLTASLCRKLAHTKACAEYFNTLALGDVLKSRTSYFHSLLG